MTDFSHLLLHFLALEIKSEILEWPAVSTPDTAIDPTEEALLREFRPIHQSSAGPREGRFQRMEKWSNGNPVAYYQAFCRNPETGKFERYGWRYMLSNGQLILHKTFPVLNKDYEKRESRSARAAR